MNKKSQIWISALLYILIIVVSLSLLLEIGLPIITKMKDKAIFTQVREAMLSLDQHITDIASEGTGSQRVIPMEVREGKVIIDNDKFRWQLETTAKILEPRTKMDLGNFEAGANIDVSLYDRGFYYLLENTHVLVNISKFGTASSFASVDTANLINSIMEKNTNTYINGSFVFIVGDDSTTQTGLGYTSSDPEGNESNLAYATVIAHINSTTLYYEIELQLDSQTDFITTKLKNVRRN